MRVPISYALFKMKRIKNDFKRLPIEDFWTFHFRKFDPNRYPCVGYARDALTIGGTMPAVLNANSWAREQAKNLIKKEHDLCY